jgi:hypothetical protein
MAHSHALDHSHHSQDPTKAIATRCCPVRPPSASTCRIPVSGTIGGIWTGDGKTLWHRVRLEKYGQEMEIHYGVGYDWRNAPIDGVTVHAAGGGKAHGR